MERFYLNSIIGNISSEQLKRNIIEFITTYDNYDNDVLAMVTGLKPVMGEIYIKEHYDELCGMLVEGAKDKIMSVLSIIPYRRYFEVSAVCLCEKDECFRVVSDDDCEEMVGLVKRLDGYDANDVENILKDYSRKSCEISNIIKEMRSKFACCNPDDEHAYRVVYLKKVEYSIDLEERKVSKV